MDKIVLEARHITKRVDGVDILQDINFYALKGETIALVGESGAGKTSLLQILGLIDTQTSGEIFLQDMATSVLSDAEKTKKRLHDVGFVYQFHHLIEALTVRENILTPRYLAGQRDMEPILKVVEKLHLTPLLDRKPHTLSGGEKQRVSVLRAVANFPRLLLADEPTGNLDSTNTEIIIDLLLDLAATYHMTLVIVTHNLDIAARMTRTVHMKDGKIIELNS